MKQTMQLPSSLPPPLDAPFTISRVSDTSYLLCETNEIIHLHNITKQPYYEQVKSFLKQKTQNNGTHSNTLHRRKK